MDAARSDLVRKRVDDEQHDGETAFGVAARAAATRLAQRSLATIQPAIMLFTSTHSLFISKAIPNAIRRDARRLWVSSEALLEQGQGNFRVRAFSRHLFPSAVVFIRKSSFFSEMRYLFSLSPKRASDVQRWSLPLDSKLFFCHADEDESDIQTECALSYDSY